MVVGNLSSKEKGVVLQCMNVMLKTSLIEEPEFQTRLGISRQELEEVIMTWPKLDDPTHDSIVGLAINNSLNEICNGVSLDDSAWKDYFDVSRQDVKQVYEKWIGLRKTEVPNLQRP